MTTPKTTKTTTSAKAAAKDVKDAPIAAEVQKLLDEQKAALEAKHAEELAAKDKQYEAKVIAEKAALDSELYDNRDTSSTVFHDGTVIGAKLPDISSVTKAARGCQLMTNVLDLPIRFVATDGSARTYIIPPNIQINVIEAHVGDGLKCGAKLVTE